METIGGKKTLPRAGLESHQAWPDLGRLEVFRCISGDLMGSCRYTMWFYEVKKKKKAKFSQFLQQGLYNYIK